MMLMIGATSGIPQWPNTRLYLIILHIHDIFDWTNLFNFLNPILFADNTNIFHSDKDIQLHIINNSILTIYLNNATYLKSSQW